MPVVELKNLNRSLGQINRRIREAGEKLDKEIDKVLFKGGNQIRNTIINSMVSDRRKEGPSGRFYGKHRASAKGEAPAVNTGELLRSILFEVNNNEMEVGSAGGAPYSEYLEDGTKNMAPRPFLMPAVEKHEKEILDQMAAVTTSIIERAINKKSNK